MPAIDRPAPRRRRAALLAAATLSLLASPALLRAADPPSATPKTAVAKSDRGWARGAVIYQVAVRSFADSDGDGVGDLEGLTAKLDYINDGNFNTATDLGADALCLLPSAPRAAGADADLDRLVAEAHRRGLKVVVAFDTGQASGGAAGHADAERLLGPWLRHGIDGFRLPGGGPVAELAAYARSIKPEIALIGDGAGGEGLTVRLDLPLAAAIVEAVKTGRAAALGIRLAQLARGTEATAAIDAPLLSDAAGTRAAALLGGDLAREKSAAAVLLTLPGAPFLDYGDELGLAAGGGAGEASRLTPMPWDATPGGGFTTGKPWLAFAPGQATANAAAERTDPGSLLSHDRYLIRARHNSAALAKGDLELLAPASGDGPVLAYLRRAGKDRALVVHNLGETATDAGPFAVDGVLDPLFTSPGVPPPHAAGGKVSVHLPPHSSGVWSLH